MAKHRYSNYVRTVREIDETVNAVGVEAFMRIEYGTLDHLSRYDIAREIELAKDMEEVMPGCMRLFAKAQSDVMLKDFDDFQAEFLSAGSENADED